MVIYALLAGFFLLTISLLIFKFELERRRSLSVRRNALENKSENDYRREKVFSSLHHLLKEQDIHWSKSSIVEYLKTYGSDLNLDCDGMRLGFLPQEEHFILVYNYNLHYNQVEHYDIDITDEGLIFHLLGNEFVGRY
ncbi:MAG: hypothetical protein GX206_08155 [Clostridiales bacterium]|nr:hypothetical protein [Clostridiales bacterium]